MVTMYCVGCRRSQQVYRTWQFERLDGHDALLQGACPACGRTILAPVLRGPETATARTGGGTRHEQTPANRAQRKQPNRTE